MSAAAVDVVISDVQGQLSESDRRLLEQETPRIDLPEQVNEVSYVVFGDTPAENLNDGILQWAGAQRPELVPDGTGEGAKWAPGTLIVAVGTDIREVGVYCGDDVCAALDLFSGSHLDRSLEEMKDPLRDKRANIAVALLTGARTAADPSLQVERTGPSGGQVAAGLAGGAVLLGGIGGGVYAMTRRQGVARAREKWDTVSQKFGDAGQRLDQIDIRANSLSSPIADAELRRQWDTVRSEFVSAGETVSELDLSPDSPNSAFWAKRKKIGAAEAALTRLENAENNIERIFQMEQGNDTVRHAELSSLLEDITKAATETKNNELVKRLGALEQQVQALRDNRSDPAFMDKFAEYIRSYGHLLSLVRDKEMDELSLEDDGRHAPRIYDRGYRVGYGYANWTPYYLMATWHHEDVRAAESASSSSTNTSFSSGFSGGGGSSGY